ncbi:DUF6005 family protein [Litoribrevibacter albus]|uniref:Carrier domain-containing protein n=1 Tax=Litoribrevibacter albus TaxID=1473156 RepID=A0AA37SBF0_9GAMM|nr:DUF6005 family protein [Litoribrevibacter albus]GLQ32865.1 hypothetical protein GCM10007876_33440 [Litoribrevibacter albus]
MNTVPTLTQAQIIQAIYDVLNEHMMIPQIDAFHPEAKLNQDLYLDSVLVLELILNLETELGLDIPDDALTKDDFETVANLADFLLTKKHQDNAVTATSETPLGITETPAEATPDASSDEAEEELDIKVHCFVSCICDILKPSPLVDHRPFYFGVWDADIVINDQHQLDYHSDTINHDNFRHWYKALYSVDVEPWYDPSQSKDANINTLLSLLDSKSDHQRVMVMIDMYRLPERENKFNQNPFPHYVMLETTEDPNEWLMLDPDFRWEGRLPKDKILHAIASPAVAGGYHFDSRQIQATSDEAIRDYFIDSLIPDHNPMTDAVRAVVTHHQQQDQFAQLPDALKQLPVLAIRKYAYEHGLAYFYLALGYDLDAEQDNEFEDLCVIIEQLVESYKLVQYRAMKLAKADSLGDQKQPLLDEIQTILDEQDAREFQVKTRLNELFNDWHQRTFNVDTVHIDTVNVDSQTGHAVSVNMDQPEAVPA